jgi:hypothetical chaperone protein
MRAPAIGLDFGTTNSSIAMLAPDGRARLARFPAAEGPSDIFRSILYFEEDEQDGRLRVTAGPEAIAAYLASEEKQGRLVQSLAPSSPAGSSPPPACSAAATASRT